MRLLRPAEIEVHGLRAASAAGGALRSLDLSVPVGARVLLVSRPEADATLLLRVLAGLVRPRGGRVLLAGVGRADDTAEGWARRIGYVGPVPAIYPWLSPREALALSARLAGLGSEEMQTPIDEMIDRFGLAPAAARPISRGGPMVAQKTALAAALLGEPELLLLDEPLRSLEPLERARLLKFPGRRLTLVIASRYPASEDGLVNQVALLRDGRLALHASLNELAQAELPLSLKGIEALAERRRSSRAGGSAEVVAAG